MNTTPRYRLSDEPKDPLEISPAEAKRLHRALPVVLVSLFVGMQYFLWLLRPRHILQDGPTPVLGPLFFLANFDKADDWIGYGLLAVMVPCILASIIWPTRNTMILAIVTILLWIGPGTMWSWNRIP